MMSSKKAFSQMRAIWRRVAFLRPGTSSTARASLPSVWRGSRVKVSSVARKEGTASQSWTARRSAEETEWWSVGVVGRGRVGQGRFDAAPTFRVAHFFERGKGFDQAGWEGCGVREDSGNGWE